MAIDGILLKKITEGIQASMPMRIQKIWEISPTEVLFQTHGHNGKQQLLFSCHSVYNRILFTKNSYPTPAEPGNFVMLLRKHLEGGTMESIVQGGLDRWCVITIRHRNTIGDLEILYLYAELLGNYANLILVNSEEKIIGAMKVIPPFENSRRTIFPGAVFKPIEPQNKKDPFQDTTTPDPSLSLVRQYAGFSPLLAKETEYRMENGQSFASVMEEIRKSSRLFICNHNNEPAFHCIPVTMYGKSVSYPLMEGFDILYYDREEKERIRRISGDIYKYVSRQLKHQKQKLPRLLDELDQAKDCDRYRTYGELLYAYNVQDTKGRDEIVLEDFETGAPVHIPLDPKLDGRGNARRSFQKYNKLKKGQEHLSEQIGICENEITYFEGLLQQLDQADFETASEIREELIRLGYLKETGRKQKRKKPNKGPHCHTVEFEGVRISYGRNNLQNEQITWHTARKNDIWLHAKDYHGAHVVIHDSSPGEDVLRFAANLAAYYSAGRASSSVPVTWCPVRNLKKIPGAKPGMVQLGSYRTIYIDPDAEQLSHFIEL